MPEHRYTIERHQTQVVKSDEPLKHHEALEAAQRGSWDTNLVTIQTLRVRSTPAEARAAAEVATETTNLPQPSGASVPSADLAPNQ